MDSHESRQPGPGLEPGAADAVAPVLGEPLSLPPQVVQLLAALADVSIVPSVLPFCPLAASASGDGIVCSNFVVRDKAGALFLLITSATAGPIRFPELRRRLGATRCLTFVSAADLLATMDAAPGAVSPLVVAVRRPPPGLTVVLDACCFVAPAALPDLNESAAVCASSVPLASDLFHFHPLDPSLSVLLRADELVRVLARARVPVLAAVFPR